MRRFSRRGPWWLAPVLPISFVGRFAAAAEPPAPSASPAFGDKGEVVVTSAFGLSLNYFHQTTPAGTVNWDFAPSAHYFISRELSVGLGVTVRRSSISALMLDPDGARLTYFPEEQTTLGVDATVGYNVVLGKLVSFWMRAELGYAENQLPQIMLSPGVEVSGSSHAAWVELFAPFLVHPAPHFFVGFGPDIWGDIVNKSGRRLSAGTGSTVGGWF
ncbi:MAG TPA: hypothetical protein VMI54_12590 [Polyangiaceae bacterium]|nr:hypothetical protein [Polyangiaceae bacterium]